MATENQADKAKKRKQRYLPQNRPVKKKGAYPLRPGVQGFFITCDGGKERQAAHEAINVIDSFFEELAQGKDVKATARVLPAKPLNKKIKFTYSDSSENEEDEEEEEVKESESHPGDDANTGCPANVKTDGTEEDAGDRDQNNETTADDKDSVEEESGNKADEIKEPPPKKQCCVVDKLESSGQDKMEKSVDKLIEAELAELGDKNKRRFLKLDSGCNGVVFIQMRKRDVDPGPKEIVQHLMESAASTKKHMSRFILRVLPILLTCYASEEEVSTAIKPMIAQYFPAEAESPVKFAVLYDARANTGIDRMKIIDAVAKSVPGPHKVDLRDPEKTIVVQIVKTVCLIGVVEKYKELAKYNLRQLTSLKA